MIDLLQTVDGHISNFAGINYTHEGFTDFFPVQDVSIPSGEIKAGVRTRNILMGRILLKKISC